MPILSHAQVSPPRYRMENRLRNVALPLLFFFSGASALLFENLWQRLMTLQFGASAPATLAILTSLFFGIALGSYLSGRRLERIRRPLYFYCCAELVVGMFGLAVPYFLIFSRGAYTHLIALLATGPTMAFAGRFCLAVLVTLPATLAMGATVPAMNRLLAERHGDVGRGLAVAYGMNILGAVLGCLASGLVLLPTFGIFTTLVLSSGLNGLVALGAAALLRSERTLATLGIEERPIAETSTDTTTDTTRQQCAFPRLLIWAYFLAGAIALGYEITWIRLLGIYSTNSALTFILALGAYLLGYGG